MGSGGSDRELRVGVAVRPLAALVSQLRAVLEGLDPGQLPARDAAEVVAVCDQLSRVADAGKALAAGRVAESSLWSRGGHRSAGHWMAKVCGISVGDAVRMLDLAETVADAPATKDALVAGRLSGKQASAVAKAEKADPAAGRQLVASAPGRTLHDVQSDARRILNAASAETPEEKAARHREQRRFRHGVNDDGMGWGSWLLPMAEHTKAVAAIEGEQAAVFDQAREDGVREPSEAYAADALCRVLDRAATNGTPVGSDGGSVEDDWSFAKVIVKIDLAALDRGHTLPGEVSEIAGQGPIPVPDVWRMIDGDAFIAAVTTKGTEISKVVHLGRKPTALQCTALEALTDGVCQIDGCSSKARLEIDHVADWAATKRTELDELARPFGHHHDLKTHHGHTFGPLQPNGKRKLIPPEPAGRAPDSTGSLPDDAGTPELTIHDGQPPPDPGIRPDATATHRGEPSSTADSSANGPPSTTTSTSPRPTSVEARARAIADRARGQGGLFDTG